MHCHLDLYPDPYTVAAECEVRGTYVLSVTTTPKAWGGTCQLSEGNGRIRTALGLHPQLAHQRSHELGLFDALLPGAKYVGEIGLDGGRCYKDHWEIQLKVFRHILKSVSHAGGRIMTIHSLASTAVVLEELSRVEGIPILHWFTGTKTQLKKAIDIGCWFSVGPAMLDTRKGSEMVLMMPRSRVLTETDGPFAKSRGKLLHPWDSEIAVNQLARLWRTSVAEVDVVLTNNLRSLLSL